CRGTSLSVSSSLLKVCGVDYKPQDRWGHTPWTKHMPLDIPMWLISWRSGIH
ncbi:hypothetical protein CEXT_748401, partial [Caerostris extrusa]